MFTVVAVHMSMKRTTSVFSGYWTGTRLQWRLTWANIIKESHVICIWKELPALASMVSKFKSNTENTNMVQYMTSSASEQDEPNLAVIGYPSGQDGAILPARDTGFVPQGKFIMSRIINPLLTKLVRSRWLENLANIQPSWPSKPGQ